MELRVLKYFITVAQEQSFSKAAKVLNVSQPALSKQIKDLEDEYQITLFNRTTRTVSLTEEGRLFKEQAIEILNLEAKIILEIIKNILVEIFILDVVKVYVIVLL